VTTTTRLSNQLAPSADLFQAALDVLPAHIAILEDDGTIVAVNAAWRGFGADNALSLADDGIGANYLDACRCAVEAGDEHAIPIVEGMQEVLSGQRDSFVFEYPCHAPHERRWFAFRISRLDTTGVARFLVSHENVTSQRLAEEIARANELRYQAVFSCVGDAILVTDERGNYLDVNPAAEELLGYSRQELLSHTVPGNVNDAIPWETRDIAPSLDQATWRNDLELVRKDGSVVPVEALATQALLPQGPIYVSAIRDMSLHRQAEAQLREEREALTIINDVGRFLSAELNLDALVQEVTDAATALTGAAMGAFFYNSRDHRGEYYTLFTLAGATVADFEGVPLPRNTKLFADTYAGKSIVRSDDIRLDPRHGKNAPFDGFPTGHLPVVSYMAVPVVGRMGDVLGGLFFGSPEPGVFTDRAEKIAAGLAAQAAIAIENARLFKQVQQELEARERAEAAKEQLVDAMAHDLGGPLTVIRGQGQLLRRRLKRGEVSLERLESALVAIDQAVERAHMLISDLTDVARLEADRPLDLNRNVVDLTAIVETAVTSFDGTSSTVTLRMEAPDESVLGHWDENRVMRVLENLLANAIKYSPAGGVVITRVSREGSGGSATGVVTISDQGMGIPADDLPHVFERFHRGSNVQGRIAGTGLGLWGSRRIVMQHGGTIEIASTEGQGTQVTVCLPLSPEPV
jgi:PAS domain S-box-containing protein